MTEARRPGVVVDTMVMSWLFADRPDPLALRYRDLIGMAPVVLAFQTIMEIRYGRYERDGPSCAVVVWSGGWWSLSSLNPTTRHHHLRGASPGCQQIGHALGGKVHDGDRWIAATAIHLGLPLVPEDRAFHGAPRLELLTAEPRT